MDAHADVNTPESSASGNVHGMPVAWLTGLAQRSGGKGEGKKMEGENGEPEDEDVFGWLNGEGGEEGVLSLKKLVYIGLRDVDAGEKEILRREGIKAFSMHDVDK